MPNTVFIVVAGIFGLIFGSFANVLILRDHERRSIVTGRSGCPRCHHELSWYELVPLLSFLIQGGRCRHCQKPISWQYPVVELGVALLAGLVAWLGLRGEYSFLGMVLLFIGLYLHLVVSVIDLRTQEVPLDYVVGAGLFGGLGQFLGGGLGLAEIGWGVLVGAGLIMSVTYTWLLLFRKEGMGSGDAWIAGSIGAVVGFPAIVVALFSAVLLGAGVGGLLIIRKKVTMEARIPFGPFLAGGLLVALLWGEPLVRWYTDFIVVSY